MTSPGGERHPGDQDDPGAPQTGENICPACAGSGRLADAPCRNCGGTGRVVEIVGDA
jgi:DnaJ-class molecular chaperone